MTAKEINFAFEMIAAIAAACPEGYTVDREKFEPIKSGYAVAVEGTQESFGNKGLAHVIKYMDQHPEVPAFGGWYRKDTKEFYFDATMIFEDESEAREFAILNKQLEYCNLTTGECIPV